MVEITPTTPEDTKEFFPRASPWRIEALTVRVNGKVVGVGGYYYNSDGARVAFVEASEADCKAYRIALAKAARKFFGMIEAQGVRQLYAIDYRNREAAARWLKHLGFVEVGGDNSTSTWRWEAGRNGRTV